MAPLPEAAAPTLPSVTLFADASLCHKTGAAGWACWAKTAGKASIMEGGALRSVTLEAAEAELFALANGLHLLRSRGWLPAEVMLQSDCMRALQIILNAFPALQSRHKTGASVSRGQLTWSAQEREAVKVIRELVDGCNLVVRHVKGHCSGGGRNWVNQQCDRIAKEHMRRTRVQIGY